MSRRSMPRWFALLLPTLALSCGGAADEQRPPNVLILSLDTLRADHLSCYGYDKPTTPRLDRLAETSTRYANCIATAPWTVPSHASLMTGLFPSEHGAISFDIEPVPGQNPQELDNARPLGPQHTTLAEVLRSEGFTTAAFVANTIYLRPIFGLSRGFDSWVVADPWLRRDVSPAWSPELTRRAVHWLETHAAEKREQPFFLFLNYYDTHRPYNITPESAHRSYDALETLYQRVLVDGLPPGPEAELVIEHFDRALGHLDASLGELFDKLEELELFDETLIVVTSDHGEFFGEHGLVEHSKDVYEEVLHVPLIVKLPAQREARVEERRTSLVDIPRIVLDALPARVGERHADTFRYVVGEHPVWAENHFSRPRDLLHPEIGSRFRRRRFALYEGTFKFIYSSDLQHELYDLAADPDEARNLYGERPSRAVRMAEKAEQILEQANTFGATQARALSAQDQELMKASGYGGGKDD